MIAVALFVCIVELYGCCGMYLLRCQLIRDAFRDREDPVARIQTREVNASESVTNWPELHTGEAEEEG